MSAFIRLTMMSGKTTLIAKDHIYEVSEVASMMQLEQGALTFVVSASGSTAVREHIDVIEDMLRGREPDNEPKRTPVSSGSPF